MQWHYIKDGHQFGPIEEAELFRLAREGRIARDDLVWNPTLYENWIPASSVENLFAAPPPLEPPPLSAPIATPDTTPPGGGVRGATHNRDLMRLARESLRNNWGLGVGATLLYWIIDIGAGFVPVLGYIVQLLIIGPLTLGFHWIFLRLARRSEAGVGQLFDGFQRFGTALGAYLLMGIFIFLWTLLLIIPGIIAGLSYAMTYFIIADDPTIGPLQAITKSKEMMRGHKWKLFLLNWRFLGWALLCILTLGIGTLWLVPYVSTSLAHFYEDIRPQS